MKTCIFCGCELVEDRIEFNDLCPDCFCVEMINDENLDAPVDFEFEEMVSDLFIEEVYFSF